MKKFEIICGRFLPWILILVGIPVGTYYITNLAVRAVYTAVIILSAGIMVRLARRIWKESNTI